MSCSSLDLKAYSLGELGAGERAPIDKHLAGCQSCREELERLNVTRAALLSLPDEEAPQRIAFVSDKVFEPRWWQTMWHSGPAMGFVSAAILAVAILVHAFTRPAGAPADAALIQQTVEQQVNARLNAAVTKAVSEVETQQDQKIAKVLDAAEKRYDAQYRSALVEAGQAAQYYKEKFGKLLVAANDSPRSAQ